MRLSLAALSVAFMLSIGCGAAEDAATATTDAVNDAAETVAENADAAVETATDAVADATTTTVSLELPGMT